MRWIQICIAFRRRLSAGQRLGASGRVWRRRTAELNSRRSQWSVCCGRRWRSCCLLEWSLAWRRRHPPTSDHQPRRTIFRLLSQLSEQDPQHLHQWHRQHLQITRSYLSRTCQLEFQSQIFPIWPGLSNQLPQVRKTFRFCILLGCQNWQRCLGSKCALWSPVMPTSKLVGLSWFQPRSKMKIFLGY